MMLCSLGIQSFCTFVTTITLPAVQVTQIRFIFQNTVLISFAQKLL